jgi:MoxR-like ATPase
MAERQVTVDNIRHELAPTFFVIATQNPVEHQGTYPLPEAQLDRFAMKLSIGYPGRDDELDLLAAAVGDESNGHVASGVIAHEQLHELQRQVGAIAVAANVRSYFVDLGRVTRAHRRVPMGLSPRGLLIWQRVAQAWAFLHQRSFVTPDDVQEVALPVLGVRLGVAADGVASVITEVIGSVPVPV